MMADNDSQVETAVDLMREAGRLRTEAAYEESGGRPALWQHDIAESLEQKVDELLKPAPDLPVVGGREVVPRRTGKTKQSLLHDTIKTPNAIGQEASIQRTDLLLQRNFDVLSLALDAAETCRAENSIEKMLAHQLALAHVMVMKIGNAAMGEVEIMQRGLQPGQATELQRLANTVGRLMNTCQQGALTIQRLKTGGNQTVTVQHVNIADGGQAVIGNVLATEALPGEELKND